MALISGSSTHSTLLAFEWQTRNQIKRQCNRLAIVSVVTKQTKERRRCHRRRRRRRHNKRKTRKHTKKNGLAQFDDIRPTTDLIVAAVIDDPSTTTDADDDAADAADAAAGHSAKWRRRYTTTLFSLSLSLSPLHKAEIDLKTNTKKKKYITTKEIRASHNLL